MPYVETEEQKKKYALIDTIGTLCIDLSSQMDLTKLNIYQLKYIQDCLIKAKDKLTQSIDK